jgi:endogenous inhibitor of DNA gyrase (YacG/DUF329 family)
VIPVIQQMTCPICKKPLESEPADSKSFRPFCSDRCRKVDFHRWWDGKYAIVEDLDPDAINPDVMNSDPEIE